MRRPGASNTVIAWLSPTVVETVDRSGRESGLAGGARTSASRAKVNEPAPSFSRLDSFHLGVRHPPQGRTNSGVGDAGSIRPRAAHRRRVGSPVPRL